MKTILCKAVKKTGKVILWPAKKYIEVTAANYEKMFGDNMRYVTFWM